MPVAISDKVKTDQNKVEIKEDGQNIEVKKEDGKLEVKVSSENFSYNDALVILFYALAFISCVVYSQNFLLTLVCIAGIVASVVLLDASQSAMVATGVVVLMVILYYFQSMVSVVSSPVL